MDFNKRGILKENGFNITDLTPTIKLAESLDETSEEIVDSFMNEVILERQNDVADIPLTDVLAEEDINFEEILTLSNEIEFDED